MRKFILLTVAVFLCCFGSVSAQAEGIQNGGQLFSLYLGPEAPLNRSNVYFGDITGDAYGGEKLDWGGDSGVSAGVQYLVTLFPYFAIGVEANGNWFQDAELERFLLSGVGNWNQSRIKSGMDVYNVMAVGRISTNSREPLRFYIPFGAGFAFSKASFELEESGWSGGLPYERNWSGREKNKSFTYYVGLGAEIDLPSNSVIGLEIRYQSFAFDYSKFDPDWGEKDLSYLSFLFKYGFHL